MSKLQTAIEIVSECKGDKQAALLKIQNTLNVTRANASVYLFKANKALEVVIDQSQETAAPEVVEVVQAVPGKTFTEKQHEEYRLAMAERVMRDLSVMSIDEYFEMTENLKEFV